MHGGSGRFRGSGGSVNENLSLAWVGSILGVRRRT